MAHGVSQVLCVLWGHDACIWGGREGGGGGGGSWNPLNTEWWGGKFNSHREFLAMSEEIMIIYQWSLFCDPLICKIVNDLLCRTSKASNFWCFSFSSYKIVLSSCDRFCDFPSNFVLSTNLLNRSIFCYANVWFWALIISLGTEEYLIWICLLAKFQVVSSKNSYTYTHTYMYIHTHTCISGKWLNISVPLCKGYLYTRVPYPWHYWHLRSDNILL